MDSFKELQDTLGLVEHEMVSIFGAEYMSRDMTIQEHRFIDKIFSDTSKIKVNLLFVVFKQLTDVKAREYLLSQLLMQNSLSSKDLFYLNNYLTFSSSKPPEYFLSINSLLKRNDDSLYEAKVNSSNVTYTVKFIIADYVMSNPTLKRKVLKLDTRTTTTTVMYRIICYLNLDVKELNLIIGEYTAMALYSDDYMTQKLYDLLVGLFGLSNDSFNSNKIVFEPRNALNLNLTDFRKVMSTIKSTNVRWQIISTIRYKLDSNFDTFRFMDMLLVICDNIDSGLLSKYNVDSLEDYCRDLNIGGLDV